MQWLRQLHFRRGILPTVIEHVGAPPKVISLLGHDLSNAQVVDTLLGSGERIVLARRVPTRWTRSNYTDMPQSVVPQSTFGPSSTATSVGASRMRSVQASSSAVLPTRTRATT